MNRAILGGVVAAIGLAFLHTQSLAQEAAKPEKPAYVGVETCGKCHKTQSKGDQLGQWQKSKHAQAYATLATPEAKEIAKKKGIADPQKSADCLKCHVTAYGVDAALLVKDAEGKPGVKPEDGVGCESCHGAGSLYKSRTVMKDQKAAIAAGLVVPDEKTCKKCHNENSPTTKPFVFAEMVKKVAHPMPEGAPADAGK
jgi:hypothetical protein